MSLETLDNLEKETIDQLKELAQINLDSKEGFELVAQQTDDPQLQSLFRDGAQQRAGFLQEIKEALALSDADTQISDSVASHIHRWWISIREKIQPSETVALLSEAERGEDTILDKYKTCVPKTAGSPLNATLNAQFESILAMRHRITELKNSLA